MLSPFRSIPEKESPISWPAFLEAIASSRRLYLYHVYVIGYLTIVNPSQVFGIVFEGHPLDILQSQ
jgi:hypothetical protein